MDILLGKLAMAMKEALNSGRPPIDAAVTVWEAAKGRRAGLNDALVQLGDQGIIEAHVSVGTGGDRRVLQILTVTSDLRAKETISLDRRVSVVHGRDEQLRVAMFQFLRSVNLHPMEWRELTASIGSGAPYIGDVLDSAFEHAQAIVVMFTPDEAVRLSDRLGGGEEGFQARPNVLFESGLALGRNPARTILVEIGALRPFSDIAGRHVIRLDDSYSDAIARRQDLAQRLEKAGCKISLRGTDWHSAGSFCLS